MAKTITVTNIKGGVAKTTTASTLAAGLHLKGFKVLMIDSDPQGNLTDCFMNEPEETDFTLYHFFKGSKSLKQLTYKIKEGLDIILGDFELCSADLEFFKKPNSLKLLRKGIEEIQDDYDYVIVDTPPNLGFLSMNAFFASTYILTPMAADSFSLKAIRLLKRTLLEVEEDCEKIIPVIGVLVTRYESNTNTSKILLDSINNAASILNTTIFDSKIRKAVIITESQLAKMDIFEYSNKAPVAKDYMEFINEFLERIK